MQYLVRFKSSFSWQGQNLVKLNCHFSWQGQYFVKFGMIAGARKVAIFNTKCAFCIEKMLAGSAKSDLGCEAGCGLTGSWSNVSDHARSGRAVQMTLQLFSGNFDHQRKFS